MKIIDGLAWQPHINSILSWVLSIGDQAKSAIKSNADLHCPIMRTIPRNSQGVSEICPCFLLIDVNGDCFIGEVGLIPTPHDKSTLNSTLQHSTCQHSKAFMTLTWDIEYTLLI